ncbi:MAG: hypothetical protein P1U63_08450 [Coxiellaceae bacterium]|nr:hypothetical protein [Coxiellaceae bacterium]
MSRDDFRWSIEKLLSRKHGYPRSLLRIIEMNGYSTTDRNGVYEYDHRDKPDYAGVPKHRMFTQKLDDMTRLRRLRLVEGSDVPETLTMQQYSSACFEGVAGRRIDRVAKDLMRIEATAYRIAGMFDNNGKKFFVHQPDQVVGRPKEKVFTAELLLAFVRCLYNVAAFQKNIDPHLSSIRFLKLLPHYNESDQLSDFKFVIDFVALRNPAELSKGLTYQATMQQLARQLIKYSAEMTVEGYLCGDKKAEAGEGMIECRAIRRMYDELQLGRNPVRVGHPELSVFYYHQRLKQSVLFSCQHLLEYFADFHLKLRQLGAPGVSSQSLYAFFKRLLPKDVMQQAFKAYMQALPPAMCALISRRDMTVDDAQVKAASVGSLSPELPEIVKIKQELVELQFNLSQMQIEMQARGGSTSTALTDYFYRDMRFRLMSLVEPWQEIDADLTGYILRHDLFVDPFSGDKRCTLPPVVTRDEEPLHVLPSLVADVSSEDEEEVSSKRAAPGGSSV